jgi:NADH-quinone oxidoreductase subunit L
LAPTELLADYLKNIAHLAPLDETAHGWHVPILSAIVCLVGFGIARSSLSWNEKTFLSLGSFGKSIANGGANRFYFDEIYATTIVKPLTWVAGLLAALDIQLVDGFWRTVTRLPNGIGSILRKWQSGVLSNYSSWMTIGLIALLLIVLFGYIPV